MQFSLSQDGKAVAGIRFMAPSGTVFVPGFFCELLVSTFQVLNVSYLYFSFFFSQILVFLFIFFIIIIVSCKTIILLYVMIFYCTRYTGKTSRWCVRMEQ